MNNGSASISTALTPDEIRQQVSRILQSPAFRGSKRSHRFLEYVAECQLSGHADALKERAIAIDVFDRNPHLDLTEDSIVRVGAREVRKRLAQYYVSPEAKPDRIRIDLPAGSYLLEFHLQEQNSLGEVSSERASLPVPTPSAARRWQIASVCLALALLAAVLAIGILRPRKDASLTFVDQFWKPALDSNEPFLVAMAHPIVYRPSVRALQLSEKGRAADPLGLQRPVQVPPEKLDGSDYLPVLDQYVGFGDAVAAGSVAAVFGSRNRNVRLRFADQLQFSDLRETPALLIGAFTNRWSLELMQGFRFRFDWSQQLAARILETTPPFRSWYLPERAKDERVTEDYILLCRIPKSATGGPLFIAAGLTQSGTEAAGTILSSPQHLAAVLQKLPRNWASKNIEVLMHARVIGNSSSPPEVIAWQVW